MSMRQLQSIEHRNHIGCRIHERAIKVEQHRMTESVLERLQDRYSPAGR